MNDTEKRIEKIKEFWNQQAEKHSADLAATMPDPLAKELELQALCRVLDPALDTLEAGCGNGYNLFYFVETFSGRLVGFDYAPAMVAAANERLSQTDNGARMSFHVANVLDDLTFLGQFPQIFTDRCLINLPSLDLQIDAITNLSRILVTGGRLVLLECSLQAQQRLNGLRERVGLDPIPYHWHNLYLDESEFRRRIPASLRLIAIDNFSSLYYVISRVFNAKLTPKGQAPDYFAEINKIARQLPSMGDYGPHKVFVLEKKR